MNTFDSDRNISYSEFNGNCFSEKIMNKKLIEKIEKIANRYNINIVKNNNEQFTKGFIRNFKNKINWDKISYKWKLSEEFMKEFQDKIIWTNVSWCQEISEQFMEEFQDKINWEVVSFQQKLSENFIRKHLDKLNIKEILICQELNDDFRNFLKTYD
jgi:hypothetical protein